MLFLCKLPEAGNILAKITQLVKFNSDFGSGCHWCVGLNKLPAAQGWERGKGLSPGDGPLAQNRSPQSMWLGIWAAAGIPVQHGGSLYLSDWNQLCGTKFSGLPPISLSKLVQFLPKLCNSWDTSLKKYLGKDLHLCSSPFHLNIMLNFSVDALKQMLSCSEYKPCVCQDYCNSFLTGIPLILGRLHIHSVQNKGHESYSRKPTRG